MVDFFESMEKSKKKICKDTLRKYYRFRKTRFYGGCATADCIGCNLRCAYCWSQKKVWYPEKFGTFYSPKEVSEKLITMNLPVVRISGGEPTICREHLLAVINLIPDDRLFILETNGILLDENYIQYLSNFKNLYVRVSLKGVDENTFEKITGANGKYFNNQLKALALLRDYGIKHRAAIMSNLFSERKIEALGISDLEFESLYDYPFVLKSLKDRGIEVLGK